jgi:RNA polymerase sigma-70 factor (ECF subfamily)
VPARRDAEPRIRAHLASGEVDEAVTLAFETSGPAILGYLGSLLPPDDARDAFSLWAEDVWRGLAGFRWECSLEAWLYRLAYRAQARLRREGYRRRRVTLPESMASRLPDNASSGWTPGSRRHALMQIRARLPPDDQTLLTLRVDRDLEWEEVAQVLAESGEDVTPAALRKRFERIKLRVAEEARRAGVLDDEGAA